MFFQCLSFYQNVTQFPGRLCRILGVEPDIAKDNKIIGSTSMTSGSKYITELIMCMQCSAMMIRNDVAS